jgi:hypothetical protein
MIISNSARERGANENGKTPTRRIRGQGEGGSALNRN